MRNLISKFTEYIRILFGRKIPNDSDLFLIKYPKKFSYVKPRFEVGGWIDMDWFKSGAGEIYKSLSIEVLNLNGETCMGSSIQPVFELDRKWGSLVWFTADVNIASLLIYSSNFLIESSGRFVIKFENYSGGEYYLPLILKGLPENLYAGNKEIIEKHASVGDLVIKYKRELKEYYSELEKIRHERKLKDEGAEYQYLYNNGVIIASDIFSIIEGEDDVFEEYAYSELDRREQELEEKYREALDWRGPLATGIASTFSGFEMRIYSDDHDSHFHVVHKGKGIDARFSYPSMELMNYKSSKNTISSKMEKKIREHCLQPEVLKNFEREFGKREA